MECLQPTTDMDLHTATEAVIRQEILFMMQIYSTHRHLTSRLHPTTTKLFHGKKQTNNGILILDKRFRITN